MKGCVFCNEPIGRKNGKPEYNRPEKEFWECPYCGVYWNAPKATGVIINKRTGKPVTRAEVAARFE